MKFTIMFLVLLMFGSANAKVLAVKIAETETKGVVDKKIPLSGKRISVWEKRGWNCTVIPVGGGDKWGVFSCKGPQGLTVSTRYKCAINTTFENSRSFSISQKSQFNAVFSIWCE